MNAPAIRNNNINTYAAVGLVAGSAIAYFNGADPLAVGKVAAVGALVIFALKKFLDSYPAVNDYLIRKKITVFLLGVSLVTVYSLNYLNLMGTMETSLNSRMALRAIILLGLFFVGINKLRR